MPDDCLVIVYSTLWWLVQNETQHFSVFYTSKNEARIFVSRHASEKENLHILQSFNKRKKEKPSGQNTSRTSSNMWQGRLRPPNAAERLATQLALQKLDDSKTSDEDEEFVPNLDEDSSNSETNALLQDDKESESENEGDDESNNESNESSEESNENESEEVDATEVRELIAEYAAQRPNIYSMEDDAGSVAMED